MMAAASQLLWPMKPQLVLQSAKCHALKVCLKMRSEQRLYLERHAWWDGDDLVCSKLTTSLWDGKSSTLGMFVASQVQTFTGLNCLNLPCLENTFHITIDFIFIIHTAVLAILMNKKKVPFFKQRFRGKLSSEQENVYTLNWFIIWYQLLDSILMLDEIRRTPMNK